MKNAQMIALLLASLVATGSADLGYGRKLLQTQTQYQGVPATITVSAANPNVNAITITLSIPYPQNPYYCNVTGDSRIPQQGVFPLTVRVPVGVTSTVIFANITGPIPGTSCTGSSVVQQQSPSSVVQQSSPSSVVQQQSSPSSVVQQQSSPSTVVQQQSSPSSVVQQQASPSSVVQQPGGTSVQQMVNSVVQQNPGGAVVQQKYATSINQQNPGASSYMNNCVSNATSVVQQQGTPSSVVQQQSPSTVVQQQSPSTVVQQQTPSSVVQQTGRHLLQVGTIEYISNNGSTGQPQLSVLDTVEGVPNISFKPTAAGQTASFSGGLQVAVTTTNDGFGTPYIPYRVDSKLSPQCGVKVNFVAI